MSDVIPVLLYRDADAAVDFLARAFGAAERQVHRDGDGTVVHAELQIGDGLLMLSTHRPDGRFNPPPGGAGVYVALDEVDAHCARARAAGAEILMEPTDQDYGSRDYIARDLEGNWWSFGTYRPT